MNSSIIVRFQSRVWHYYDSAPDEQAYLRFPHRHTMNVEVEIEVHHDDRDIEFHAFQQFCEEVFPQGDVGQMSCEMLAKGLIDKVERVYGNGRNISVSVFEDDEVGAKVTKQKEVV